MDAVRIKPLTMLLCLTGIVAVEAGMRLAIGGETPPPMALLGAGRLLQAALVMALVSAREKRLSSIGLSWRGLVPGLGKGVIWSAGFGLLALFSGLLLHFFGVDPITWLRTPLPSKTGSIVLLFIVGGVVAPIAEEVLFRGVLYGFLRQWGAPAAILLSTLLFVLVHRPGAAIPVTQIVGGILFAVAYEVEKNLMVPITIHSLGNLSIFALSLTQRLLSGPP